MKRERRQAVHNLIFRLAEEQKRASSPSTDLSQGDDRERAFCAQADILQAETNLSTGPRYGQEALLFVSDKHHPGPRRRSHSASIVVLPSELAGLS